MAFRRKLGVVGRLQLYHIIVLLLSALLVAILYIFSGPDDQMRALVKVLFALIDILWPVVLLLHYLTKSIEMQNKAAFKGLLDQYKRLLNQKSFLRWTNILLTVITIGVLYILLISRQVEFSTHHDGKVIVFLDQDNTPNDVELGTLTPDTPLKIRLYTGENLIYYRSGEKSEVRNIEVLPIYQTIQTIHFVLDYDKELPGR